MGLVKQKTSSSPSQVLHDEQAIDETHTLASKLLLLQSQDSGERRSAARALVEHHDAGSALIDALTVEPVENVRSAILSSLIQIGDTDSFRRLLGLLNSDNINLRNEVFEVLKARPEISIPLTNKLLTDDDPDIRIYAVNLLEVMHDENIEEKLIEVLQTDFHVNVCAAAINLLSEVGTKSCASALESVKLRFSDEAYICFTADLILGRIHESGN